MMSIRNCGSLLSMGISTREGIVRQSTGMLELLDFNEPVEGTEVIMIDDMVIS